MVKCWAAFCNGLFLHPRYWSIGLLASVHLLMCDMTSLVVAINATLQKIYGNLWRFQGRKQVRATSEGFKDAEMTPWASLGSAGRCRERFLTFDFMFERRKKRFPPPTYFQHTPTFLFLLKLWKLKEILICRPFIAGSLRLWSKLLYPETCSL